MPSLYPLRFLPVFRRYLWGGRRLQTVLGKSLPEGDDYAESWEVVDHGADQSVVANGPLAGATLAEIVASHGQELFGRHHPQPRFPLLFKFLDAQRDLSVQVHPNDQQAARLDPPDFGKTEAWVILDAAPGSCLYAGLRDGVDRAALARAIEQGATETCLHRIEPRPGDCVFIPAGTVHALGQGLLVAEIQQSSDTTYRIFDWNRLGADGRPRPLHIEQALEVIDFQRGPTPAQTPRPTESPHVSRLVECDKFVLNRIELDQSRRLDADERFHIVTVLAGRATIATETLGKPETLAKGETLLLPASCGEVELASSSAATLLDMTLP